MGIAKVVFGRLLPTLGKNLEINPAKAEKIFENVYSREKILQKAEFGDLFENFGEIPKIRLNTQDISQFNEYTRNMLLNIPNSALRETCTSLISEAVVAVKKGCDYRKYLDSIIEDASLLDGKKDKRFIDELNKILKSLTEKFEKINKGKFVHYDTFENEIVQTSELVTIPARARGEVMNIQGRVRKALKANPKLKEESHLKDLEESMKQESLVSFLSEEAPILHDIYSGLSISPEFKNFLYEEYYLKRYPFRYLADEPLKAINKFYGVKVFVPYKTTEEVTDDILREFHAWNKAGGKNVNWESTLSFDDFDPKLYSDEINRGGCSGYASFKNFIRVRGNLAKIRENFPIMRHERLHRQDFMKRFGKFGKNGEYDFTEGSKILTEKKWYRDEFRKAGIPEWHIDYAYTNRAEFIAVAAEGNAKAYSEEFKQVLIELGMPEWFFNIRKFKSYNA